MCLTAATTGAQTVRQCPLSERQAAIARPVVATGFVVAAYQALQSARISKKKALITIVTYAAFFQLPIEIFDGMYRTYGVE